MQIQINNSFQNVPIEFPFFARVENKIIFDNKIWDSPLTEDKFISSLTLEMAKAYFTPNNPNSGRVLVGINNLEKFHWKNTYPVPVPNTAQMVETHVTKSMPFLDFLFEKKYENIFGQGLNWF